MIKYHSKSQSFEKLANYRNVTKSKSLDSLVTSGGT